MSHDELDDLLERMVPGSGHRSLIDADAPPFPAGLGLQPLGVLARGSTGWVFRANDPLLDRVVAVKISRPDQGAEAREALLAEARATASLAHPAVLPVHRVAAAGKLLCVIFALGPETTLAHRLADWRRAPESVGPVSERLSILHQVAQAIAAAHRQGLIHGDLKPANVALDDDAHPYVLDWSGLLQRGGRFSGTPEFAAPEQLQGEAPTEASDVFALAAVAWELLSLRPLRPARARETVAAYLARHADPRTLQPVALEPLGVDPTLVACLQAAIDPDPSARPGADQLVETIASARTGRAEATRRAEAAAAELQIARRQLVAFHERERRLEEAKRVIMVQRSTIPPHAPPRAREALWRTEARVHGLIEAQAGAWTEALEHAVTAANLCPDDDDAHALIAELWWERLRMAEARGYVGERRLAEARVRRHDRGRYTDLMDTEASVSVSGSGTVEVIQVEREGHHLVERPLSTHPLPAERLPLAPGSWVLRVCAPNRAPLRIPIALDRLEHLQIDPTPLEVVPAGWCLVPAGPFRMGGDEHAQQPIERCTPWLGPLLMQRTPVTSADYLAFLDAQPPDLACELAPATTLIHGPVVPLWTRGASGWRLPSGWHPDWPITGIGLVAVEAYAAWLSRQLGRRVRLPTEEEWEKGARGADGRIFPWGDAFDPAWCHMASSLTCAPRPLPVGSFEADRSPHGLADVAGGVREWTSSVLTVDRYVVRGGGWASEASACRLASRSGVPADARLPDLGFRLVSDL
ncbi:MAG TPA: hypothetical protein ENK18_19790 [Deltaproteobacteria bacterium]|nr:hypothetical protein [Deltaproteobacteria bacterium]